MTKKKTKKAADHELNIIGTIMTPEQAGRLSAWVDGCVHEQLGSFKLPITALFYINVIALEMFARGVVWGRVPLELQDECLFDMIRRNQNVSSRR